MVPNIGREPYSVEWVGKPVAEVEEPEAVTGAGIEVVGQGVELGVEVPEGMVWLFSEFSVPAPGLL